jgi:hypothetical protein
VGGRRPQEKLTFESGGFHGALAQFPPQGLGWDSEFHRVDSVFEQTILKVYSFRLTRR